MGFFRYSRDFFGWRSRLLTDEQASRGQPAIGNQKNVCAKSLRRRRRLWALNDRRGDLCCPAHGWRTPQPGGWPGQSREDSGNAGVNGQGMRNFATLHCAWESDARVRSRWSHRERPTWRRTMQMRVSPHGSAQEEPAAGCLAHRLRCEPCGPCRTRGNLEGICR